MPSRDFGAKPRRQWAPDARALSVVGDRWLMVIVRDLAAGPLRLDELRRWLPGVSAGALEARLHRMVDEGLIVRRRYRSLPPRVDLELTERGRELLTVIGELARWELRTHWSCPREDEWVDVAACFRLAPFLVPGPHAFDGELGLTISRPREARETREEEHYAFVREGGRAKVEHRPAARADAEISGSEAAWVRALSPTHDPGGLAVAGDRDLAQGFLDLFVVGAPRD
jgi:DNA-binding HxlR family transcriptional regulator